ncbi:hypothetical protein ACO0LM_25130 [Undibacterium sp. Di26W]|uniref:hypothetical protein n=1 Tax=Undibacterium sp. Di26W TaxID=3413035 RepID=UPI003BF0622E
MSNNHDDDLIFAVNNVKYAVDEVKSETEEVWNATRRLDDAICGAGGVISHLYTITAMLNRIFWLLLALLVVSILHLFK